MLHTLAKSPSSTDLTTLCRLVKKADVLLLLQDGILFALNHVAVLEQLLNTAAAVFVLQEDVIARGLMGKISAKVQLINYDEFVHLSENHTQHMAW